MKLWIAIAVVAVVVVLLLVNSGSGWGSEQAVRKTVEAALKAAEAALNSRNVSIVDSYFASVAEGANADGLQETLEALNAFAASLSATDQVQFHGYTIQNVEVHDSGGLARVKYELHLSVVRNGSQLVFGATVTQNLALLKTARGWRISGGDIPQLSEVTGQWQITK